MLYSRILIALTNDPVSYLCSRLFAQVEHLGHRQSLRIPDTTGASS